MKKLSVIFFSSVLVITLAACIVSQNNVSEANDYGYTMFA